MYVIRVLGCHACTCMNGLGRAEPAAIESLPSPWCFPYLRLFVRLSKGNSRYRSPVTVVCNTVMLDTKQMSILIADDKPQIRRIIRSMLEAHPGWEVCAEAEDGVQAVARAKQCKPDLILLDLAMPEMNGFEAAREISSALPGTPILLNTLYASPQVEKEAEKVGVLGVISKSEQYRLIPAIEEAFAVKQLSS